MNSGSTSERPSADGHECARQDGHVGMHTDDPVMAEFLNALGREETFEDVLTYSRASAPRSDCECEDCVAMKPS